MRKIGIASALALAWVSVPAGAVTVLEFDDLLSYSLAGPAAGYQQKITIEAVSGQFGFGDPNVSWSRDLKYLYNDEFGQAGNEYPEEAMCGPGWCNSASQFTQLIGTSLSFTARSARAYNHCADTSAQYVTCGYNPDYDLGRITLYGESDGTGPARFRLTLGDITAIPEPASWAMLLSGFALAGLGIRRRKSATKRHQVVSVPSFL